MGKVLKLAGGVPSGKLKAPPNSCMPSKAKIKMNKKSRNNRERIERIELSNDITRFLKDDQYLHKKKAKKKITRQLERPKRTEAHRTWHSLGDFEDPKKSQGAENRKSERSRFERRPNDFKYGTADHDAVEPIERRLEVDPWPQRVHFDQHFGHEQTQKGEFRIVCREYVSK